MIVGGCVPAPLGLSGVALGDLAGLGGAQVRAGGPERGPGPELAVPRPTGGLVQLLVTGEVVGLWGQAGNVAPPLCHLLQEVRREGRALAADRGEDIPAGTGHDRPTSQARSVRRTPRGSGGRGGSARQGSAGAAHAERRWPRSRRRSSGSGFLPDEGSL